MLSCPPGFVDYKLVLSQWYEFTWNSARTGYIYQ